MQPNAEAAALKQAKTAIVSLNADLEENKAREARWEKTEFMFMSIFTTKMHEFYFIQPARRSWTAKKESQIPAKRSWCELNVLSCFKKGPVFSI